MEHAKESVITYHESQISRNVNNINDESSSQAHDCVGIISETVNKIRFRVYFHEINFNITFYTNPTVNFNQCEVTHLS